MHIRSLLLGSVACLALTSAAVAFAPFDDLGSHGGYGGDDDGDDFRRADMSMSEPDPKRTGDDAEDDASDKANDDVLDRENPDKGSGDGDTNDKTGNDEQRDKGGDVG